jgi:hypothetical protein
MLILKFINNYDGIVSFNSLECFKSEELYASVVYARDSKYRKHEYAHECNRFLNNKNYQNVCRFLRKKGYRL